MKKDIRFGHIRRESWPDPNLLKPFFIANRGQEWTYLGGNDCWGMSIGGLYGTEARPAYGQNGETGPNTQVEANLTMWGSPGLGVLIYYSRYGGGLSDHYYTVSDRSKLNQWVTGLHDTPLPVGLFIPFRDAWPAVKEFMETEGELPKSIEWIAARDLPAGTFPDP